MTDDFLKNVRAQAEIRLRASGAKGLRLNGGPMDGWFVKEDADVLKPTWYKTWPATTRTNHMPGRYVVSEEGTWADWHEFEAPGGSRATQS